MLRGLFATVITCVLSASLLGQEARVYGPLPQDGEPAHTVAPAREADPPATEGPRDLSSSPSAGEKAHQGASNSEASEALPLGAMNDGGSMRERLLGREEPLRPADGAGASVVEDGWWRTAMALGGVVLLVLLLGACFRRWAAGSAGLILGGRAHAPSGVVEMLARYPIGRGQQLLLMRIDRRVLVLHQTHGSRGGGMRTLAELTEPEEVASLLRKVSDADGSSMTARFKEIVKSLDSRPAEAVAHEPVVLEREVSARAVAGRGDPVGILRSRLEELRGVEGAAR